MNNKLTLEQLRFARSIGATHYYKGVFVKSGDGINASSYSAVYGWDIDIDITDPEKYVSAWENKKINFSTLDEAEHEAPRAAKMHASDFLQCGINHMRDREKTYDAKGGERSMGKTVAMFNSLYGLELTEQQGWAFMCILKIVRTSQGAFRSDNYEDLAAYAGLMGESAQELGK